MLTILIAAVVGALGGTVAGAVVSRWTVRRQPAPPATLDDLSLDPDLDQRITEAAHQWATQQGQPDAAPLVAGKLRLVYVLGRGRKRRCWWRSSW
ncbi:MAG TPA: hypothetical protein VG147_07975 [Solirubrobacteraceae bacterium]|jgi:hypothetical protein|nr:hypothetical protein [Solirubrobacteraceae bacterium]